MNIDDNGNNISDDDNKDEIDDNNDDSNIDGYNKETADDSDNDSRQTTNDNDNNFDIYYDASNIDDRERQMDEIKQICWFPCCLFTLMLSHSSYSFDLLLVRPITLVIYTGSLLTSFWLPGLAYVTLEIPMPHSLTLAFYNADIGASRWNSTQW